MKRRRAGAAAAEEEPWDQTQQQEGPEADVGDQTGWRTSTVHLSGIARLGRGAAWMLIASGPLLGIAALLGSAGPAHVTAAPAATAQPASDTGPSGFAQLFVQAYLEAGQGTESSLSPYYSGTVTLTTPPDTRAANSTTAVASQQVQPGYWTVTVATRVVEKNSKGVWQIAGLEYYQVPVQALGPASAGGSKPADSTELGYTATALPAQVAAPQSLTPSSLGYGTDRGSAPSDPATQTIAGFLASYLVGHGELDRYTSPGVTLQPVSPAPYTEVDVTDVADDSGNASSSSVPADGTVRHSLAKVTVKDTSGGTYPLTYALTLRARGGRWEVLSLGPAPVLQSGSAPAPATPSPGAGSDGDSASDSPSPSGS